MGDDTIFGYWAKDKRSMLVTNSVIDLHQALNNKGEAFEVRGQIIRFEEGDFEKGK